MFITDDENVAFGVCSREEWLAVQGHIPLNMLGHFNPPSAANALKYDEDGNSTITLG